MVKPAETKTGKEFKAVFGDSKSVGGAGKTAKSSKSSGALPLSSDRLLEDRIYLSILAGTMDGQDGTKIEKSVRKKVSGFYRGSLRAVPYSSILFFRQKRHWNF